MKQLPYGLESTNVLSELMSPKGQTHLLKFKDARAGAHATSCTMKMLEMEQIKDLQQNSVLSDDFAFVMSSRHGHTFVPNEEAGASTDFVS